MTVLPSELPPDAHTRVINAVSYVLVAAMIAAVLWLHLSPATMAGFFVYTLARKLEACLRRRHTLSQRAKAVMVIYMFAITALILTALGIGIGRLVKRGHGLEDMLTCIADVPGNLQESLPAVVVNYVPQSVTELRVQLIWTVKKHGRQVPTLSIDGLRASVLVLVGLILGATVAWSKTPDSEYHKPLAIVLASRLSRLTNTFETMVFIRVKTSAFNTAFAAIYLLGALPLFGQHVSHSKSLTLLTFVVGLTLVADDLISDTAIAVMSMTAPLELMMTSLIFLVMVYKLKYFVDMHIIGGRINARTWGLILALVVMGALFDVGGVIATPVLHAYVKHELADAGLID